MRHSESTLDVGGAALCAVRVQAELVQTPRGADGGEVRLTRPAVHGPIVIAVVVRGALAVVQKTVLALLQGDGSVHAQEEVVAQFRVLVRLHSKRLRACRHM